MEITKSCLDKLHACRGRASCRSRDPSRRRTCRGCCTDLPAVEHTSSSTRSRLWSSSRQTYTSPSAYSCTGTCSCAATSVSHTTRSHHHHHHRHHSFVKSRYRYRVKQWIKTSVSETVRKPPLVKAWTALKTQKIWRKTIFNMADGIRTSCNVARS